MSQSVMSLDSEAVAVAVNSIDIAIQDIQTRNNAFLDLLEEKNNQTKGKFALIKTLSEKVREETVNIKNAIEAVESIKEALRRYEDLAEQANDDSDFR